MKAMNSLGHGENWMKSKEKFSEWNCNGIAVGGQFWTLLLEKGG